jgi:predicted RNase H-like HicB family nuclease
MFQFTYPAKIKKDAAGFFLVTFPDIPFAATDGKTMAEALEEAIAVFCKARADL